MYDNLEDNDFNIHRRENFKSYMFYKIVDENLKSFYKYKYKDDKQNIHTEALTCNIGRKNAEHLVRLRRCSYEVPGMILLRHLQRIVRLDRSKIMFVHVSICISYDFIALTPVVWELRW